MLLYDNLLKKIQESEKYFEGIKLTNINTITEGLATEGRELTDYLIENDPTDNDKLSELISKMSCVTVQMWNNQEILYKWRRISTEQFVKDNVTSLDEVHKIIKRCCDLNVQRAKLMDAIDKKMFKEIRG
ncbi:hypothetical protein CCP1ISM_20024 [Azospirillaceae bacterium]